MKNLSLSFKPDFNILIVLILFILAGCSKIDMAYDWAPRLSANFLDKYFDFSSERYDKVKATLVDDFQKNKPLVKEALTKRIDMLNTMSDKKEFTESEITILIQDLRSLQPEVVNTFKSSVAEVVMNMSKEELSNLKEEVAENHKKFSKRLEDRQDYKKKQIKSFDKNMDSAFDSVTDEQIEMYSQFIDQNYEYYKANFEFRKNEMTRLESLFSNKEAMLAEALKYYSGDDSIKSAELQEKQKVFLANLNIFIRKIWPTITEKQKSEFKKTLAELKSELAKLK